MRIAWATDLHLDALGPSGLDDFCAGLREARVDELLLGGDISTAMDVFDMVRAIARRSGLDPYFVLGNHDYYGSAIASVREAARNSGLRWLPGMSVVALTQHTALVGHGGWADATVGDFDRAPLMTDFLAIEELVICIDREDLLDGFRRRERLRARLLELGQEAARALRPGLEDAAARYTSVLVLTHVPPFAEAAWHRGGLSPPDWQPNVVCGAVGDLIREVAASHPDTRFEVLCGHTHGSGVAELAANLRVRTGGAYGERVDFTVLEIE